jgi:hypothetical protein
VAEVSGFNRGGIQNPNTPNQPVNRSGDIAQTGGIRGSQKVQKALDKGTEQTTQVIQKQQIQTIARRMTARDVVNQLLSLDIRPTAENRNLAMKMLLHGLELSKSNFIKLESMLQGTNRSAFTEQAAIVLISKGITSRTAVVQLANFLENNPQLSSQLTDLLNSLGGFKGALSGSSPLSSVLTAQLSAIVASLDGFISMLPQEIKDKLGKGKGLFDKAKLLTNMRAFTALLNGVKDKVLSQEKTSSNSFLNTLSGLSKQAKDVAENIIVQAILAKPTEREDSALSEKFSYWQVPNSLATPPETVELLIERDKKNKYQSINHKKTKMIFKTETESLGEIAIEVDVEDKNLDFRFNTKEEEIRKLINTQLEDLKNKLEAHNYKTKTVRVVKRNLDVKKFLIPTLDLNDLTRVQTEV